MRMAEPLRFAAGRIDGHGVVADDEIRDFRGWQRCCASCGTQLVRPLLLQIRYDRGQIGLVS